VQAGLFYSDRQQKTFSTAKEAVNHLQNERNYVWQKTGCGNKPATAIFLEAKLWHMVCTLNI
jgi:hypothetical protein